MVYKLTIKTDVPQSGDAPYRFHFQGFSLEELINDIDSAKSKLHKIEEIERLQKELENDKSVSLKNYIKEKNNETQNR